MALDMMKEAKVKVGDIQSCHPDVKEIAVIQSSSTYKLGHEQTIDKKACLVLLKTNPIIVVKYNNKIVCIGNRQVLNYAILVLGANTTINVKLLEYSERVIRLFAVTEVFVCAILFSMRVESVADGINDFNCKGSGMLAGNGTFSLCSSKPVNVPASTLGYPGEAHSAVDYQRQAVYSDLFTEECLSALEYMFPVFVMRDGRRKYIPIINRLAFELTCARDLKRTITVQLISRPTLRAVENARRIENILCRHLYCFSREKVKTIALLYSRLTNNDLKMIFCKAMGKQRFAGLMRFSRQQFYTKKSIRIDINDEIETKDLSEYGVKK